MNRRDFLKSLVAVSAITVATASGLELPDIKYPKINYNKEWDIRKMTWLHMVDMPIGKARYYIAEYSDDEYLPEWLLDDMINKLKEKQSEIGS